MNVSPSVSSGISIGKPPACQTPRLTSSARRRKCVWHGLASLHVLRMAMTGLPAMSSALKPACLRARAVAERAQIVLPNQRWLRRSVGVLRGAAHASRSRRARATGASCCRAARGVERRHERGDRTGRRDAGELGGVVQHARRAPRVAQVLERHERGAQRLGRASSPASTHAAKQRAAAAAARCTRSRSSCRRARSRAGARSPAARPCR